MTTQIASLPTNKKLLLDSLVIKNFKAFGNLTIRQLGRVNLIVGKNNVGKSSILEALKLYADPNHSTIWQLMLERGENLPSSQNELEHQKNRARLLTCIFHKYNNDKQIQIGSHDKSIQIGFRTTKATNQFDNFDTGFVIEANGDTSFDRLDGTVPNLLSVTVKNIFLPAEGANLKEIDRLWDQVALTDEEPYVINALRLIAKNIDRVALRQTNGNGSARTPFVRLTNIETPFPLGRMGEGMNRLFAIALALVNAKNGLLLIDEIESGLHYSVQLDLWRMIFDLAHRLNVQVFATTHSRDCIEAFSIAAEEDKHEEAMLIRLENRRGEVVPVILNEELLTVATSQEIEVR